MPTVDIYNVDGKVVGSMDLNENVFGVEVRPDVMHEVVVNYLANQRQGTQSTKPVPRFVAAVSSPGDRRVPVVPVRVVSVLLSGLAAA